MKKDIEVTIHSNDISFLIKLFTNEIAASRSSDNMADSLGMMFKLFGNGTDIIHY